MISDLGMIHVGPVRSAVFLGCHLLTTMCARLLSLCLLFRGQIIIFVVVWMWVFANRFYPSHEIRKFCLFSQFRIKLHLFVFDNGNGVEFIDFDLDSFFDLRYNLNKLEVI